jgi:hypothetical protein
MTGLVPGFAENVTTTGTPPPALMDVVCESFAKPVARSINMFNMRRSKV